MEKKSKRSIIIGITTILLVALTLLGLTYAYYRTRIVENTAEKSVSVSSKKLEVVYQNESAYIEASGIGPNYIITKTFEVKNNGDEAVKYSIVFDEMNNEFQRNTDWEYELYEGTYSSKEALETAITGGLTPIENGNIAVGTHQVISGSIEIAAPTDTESVHSYTLRLEYVDKDEDQSSDMGSNLTLRINISEESYTWEDAPQGSLLYALKANQPSGTETTTPGQEASTANEKRILTTEDDYGTSYVYRGNVDNNYLTYSNMCWRIVRVQGDGTIKLALADWAHPCGTENGYDPDDTDSGLIADGTANTNISYVVDTSNPTYDMEDAVFENSNIVKTLKSWVNNVNLDMEGLIETEWCNDTTVGLDPEYSERMGGAKVRLSNISTANPTLKCNMNGMEGTTGYEAKATRYKGKVGILSADEVAFAGKINGSVDSDYLLANASIDYWTLTAAQTPNTCQGICVFCISSKSGINEGGHTIHVTNAIRPSIVLRSDVMLNTTKTLYIQDGGIDTPYVIK